jgi:hypothetical protein
VVTSVLRRVGYTLAALLGISIGIVICGAIAGFLAIVYLGSDEMAPIRVKVDRTLPEHGAWHAGTTSLCSKPGEEKWMQVEAREFQDGRISIDVGEHRIDSGEQRTYHTIICFLRQGRKEPAVKTYYQRPGEGRWFESDYGEIGGTVRVSSDPFAPDGSWERPEPPLIVYYDLLTRPIEGSERSVGLVALRSSDLTK